MSRNWLRSDGEIVHPSAPAGGGGAGNFRGAGRIGSDVDAQGIAHPDSPVGRRLMLSDQQKSALKDQYDVPPGRLRKWVQELMLYDADDGLSVAEAKDFLKSYEFGGRTVAAEGVRNITEVSNALAGYVNIKQVTFNTHGSPGAAWISSTKGIALDTDALLILPIPHDLFLGEGRLLFFGCNIAEFKAGEDFLVAAGKHFFRHKGGVVGGSTVATTVLKAPWATESVIKDTSVTIVGESSEIWFTLPLLGEFRKRKIGEVVCFRLDGDGKIIGTQRVKPFGL